MGDKKVKFEYFKNQLKMYNYTIFSYKYFAKKITDQRTDTPIVGDERVKLKHFKNNL